MLNFSDQQTTKSALLTKQHSCWQEGAWNNFTTIMSDLGFRSSVQFFHAATEKDVIGAI